MCLVYNPEEIAVAAIYAALASLRKELPPSVTDGGRKSFFEVFNVKAERLQGECHACMLTGEGALCSMCRSNVGDAVIYGCTVVDSEHQGSACRMDP
jgi:hypothetical protein